MIRKKWLFFFSLLYLFSSVVIFLIGYVNYYISIPLTILLSVSLILTMKDMPDVKNDFKNKKIIIILLIIAIWVLLSGVGGIVWQNRWDHKFRNAVFNDLVLNKWPVQKGKESLVYYLGYWLPSAVFGKLFGIKLGYIFQYFWALVGVSLAVFLLFEFTKKIQIHSTIIFIFFSGLDYICFFVKNVFLNENIKSILVAPFCGTHFELTLFVFNSSSNTTLLFWLYNQIIPFWIGFLLLINQKNNKSIGLIYASLFLYSPFPCVTLAPVVIYMIFKNYSNENVKTIEKVKSALSIQNIASVPLFVIIATFIVSNNSARKIELLKLDKSNMFLLLAFLVTEVIVYLIFVYNKKDIILNILIITTIITSFVVMGDSYDFAWRTAIPLSFYLMLLTIKYLNNTHVNKMKKRLLIVLICIGALTPLSEISRTLRCEYNVIKGKDTAMSDSLDSIFEKDNNDCRNNFISDDSNSIFFNYIAKQNTEDEYERFTNNR